MEINTRWRFLNSESVYTYAGDSDIGVGEVWRLDVYFASDSKNFNGENKWIITVRSFREA